MTPSKPAFYWVRPTDRFELNEWQPCQMDKFGNVRLLGTSMSYNKTRYAKWEWGHEIIRVDDSEPAKSQVPLPADAPASGPGGHSFAL